MGWACVAGAFIRVQLSVGDPLDFWRVEALVPDSLLRLRAEMRLPGDAWLQWQIEPDGTGATITQTARFHPRGLLGRLYWIAVAPFHRFIFPGLLAGICADAERLHSFVARCRTRPTPPVCTIRPCPRTGATHDRISDTRPNTESSESTLAGVTPERLAGLRRWNLGLTVLHAAQAVLILVMASDFAITVTSTFPQGPPGTRLTTPEGLFDVPIGPAIAVFLLLAAFDHFATATFARQHLRARPGPRHQPVPVGGVLVQRHPDGAVDRVVQRHHRHHRRGGHRRSERRHDPVRLAAGTHEPTRTDIDDDDALLVRHDRRRRTWVAIWVNVIGAPEVPGFVYGIVIAELVFFFSFGLNQWLQYRGVGRWRDYAYGEKTYLVLSLAAKSLLAWQIYGGSLAE